MATGVYRASPEDVAENCDVDLLTDIKGRLVVNSELSDATAIPTDNTELISSLTLPMVRTLLTVVDSNGLTATTKLAGGTANNDTLGAASYKSLYVIGQQLVLNGTTWDRLRTPSTFKVIAAVAITAATGATIWTPAAGKKFRLMGYSISASAAASLKFYDGAGGALTTQIFRGPLLAAAGIDSQYNLGNGILSAAANNTLALDVTGNATVTGTVWGTEE